MPQIACAATRICSGLLLPAHQLPSCQFPGSCGRSASIRTRDWIRPSPGWALRRLGEVITDRYRSLGSRGDASLRSSPCSSQATTRNDCSSSWRWASGRLVASSRRTATASSIAASASSRRPRPASRTARLCSEPARSGRNASGRPRPGPCRCRWLPGSWPARPLAGPGLKAGPPGCSASWLGRAGMRPGGPRPVPCRCRRLPRSRPARPPAGPARPGCSTGCATSRPGQGGGRGWSGCWLASAGPVAGACPGWAGQRCGDRGCLSFRCRACRR